MAAPKTKDRNGSNPTAKIAKSRVTNKVTLDPRNPIPLELGNIPLSSVDGRRYIPFLSPKDNFFNTLLEARLQSTTQNACVVTKTNYTVGDGVVIRNLKDKQVADPQWLEFFKYSNNKRQGFNRVYRTIVETFLTFGNVPIEIVVGSAGKKKFLNIYVKNQLDCRLEWPDKNFEVNNLIVSRFFRKQGSVTLTEENCTAIPLYKAGPGTKDKMWLEGKDADGKPTGVKRTAIWLKNDVAGYDYYGLPSYVSALINELQEYQGGRYNLDNLENNMTIGGMLILTGNLSEDEASKVSDTIINQHSGEGKRGRVAVVASEEGIDNSKYISYDTHKDGSFIELDDKAMQKIIFANEWDSVLAGLPSGGGLGKGNGYLNEVYQQKLKTVIRPLHRLIHDSVIVPLCEIADAELGTKWSEYEIDVQTSNLFDDTTEANTTVKGIEAFLKVVEMVATGAWTVDAATKFVSTFWGKTETEATAMLGNITVVPNIKVNNINNKDVQP